tara:strand:- start:453 stop:1595 length:1143 start_codon:yes stop_codon:yes gene_type:complete
MSNQRPSSTAEFKHTTDHKARTLNIDSSGICDACRYSEIKEQIDWSEREQALLTLLDKHRRTDGYYDCIVPGSGGKDSGFAAHILKDKYDMHPLTVTWPPSIYTDYGYENFKSWLDVGGFDNITVRPNGSVNKLLTKLSIENLFHPFHCFTLGQKNLAPKVAMKYKVPLIFYGESEAEYGNPIAENSSSLRDASYYTTQNLNGMYLSGVSLPELQEKYNLSLNDINIYLPAQSNELDNTDIEVHYLGYYLKWTPQEAYYYAVENTGFQSRPFRTEGTYNKYNSIDDKLDDLHFYTTYIKFGLGRATYDASQEIRNNHLTRDEGVTLVHKFDGEFPTTYFNEVMDYMGMNPEYFLELCDKFRSPHLWEYTNTGWLLRNQVQ